MNTFAAVTEKHDWLLIEGDDAETFLQGQLTCDLEKLADHHSCYGAICNNKGRIVSSFLIIRINRKFYLRLSVGMGTLTSDYLAKYSVFYKVTIKATPFVYSLGVIGKAPLEKVASQASAIPESIFSVTSSETSLTVRLPDADSGEPAYCFYLHESESQAFEQLKNTIEKNLYKESSWASYLIQTGFFYVTPAYSEKFTPQELNYDLLGAVSFDKGCYTGQEIVARLHYRGTAKSRLAHFSSARPIELTVDKPDKTLTINASEKNKYFTLSNTPILLLNNNFIEGLSIIKTALEDEITEISIAINEQEFNNISIIFHPK